MRDRLLFRRDYWLSPDGEQSGVGAIHGFARCACGRGFFTGFAAALAQPFSRIWRTAGNDSQTDEEAIAPGTRLRVLAQLSVAEVSQS